MAFLIRLYARCLESNFYATHMVTAGALYGGGDVLAQRIEKAKDVQSPGKTGHNYQRSARMFLFGFCLGGPVMATWYGILHRMTSVYRYEYVAVQSTGSGWLQSVGGIYRRDLFETKGRKFLEVSLKVVLDQFLFQAPYLNMYLLFMSFLEGKNISEGWEQCKTNFHDAWSYSILFWCPAQYFNFLAFPVQYHALTVNFYCMLWTAFLSVLYHSRDYGHHTAASHAETAKALSSADVATAHQDSTAGAAMMTPGEQISDMAGNILQRADRDVRRAARAAGTYGDRASSAVRAAVADWTVSSPGSTIVGMQESELTTLREQLEHQRLQISGQELELEVMRRTIVSQAIRVQVLQEHADEAARTESSAVGAPSATSE